MIRHAPRAPLRELPASRPDVMLVPGFLAGDSSLRLLARFLQRAGYGTVASGIARNVDCSEATLSRLSSRLEAHATGGRIAIVGHSRGGLLARALACRHPDRVAGVITLGSPLRDQLAVHPALWTQIIATALAGTAGAPDTMTLACSTGPCCAPYRADLEAPLPDAVPLVSVYSQRDGVVDWRACRDRDGRSVEVTASHVGMVAHAATFRAVVEALDSFARATARRLPHRPAPAGAQRAPGAALAA
jgi:pimeloyl-ACP methyl ester carboxylesterase